MFNSRSFFNKKNISFRDASFDCANCKMGKSKIMSFPTHCDINTECFDLVHSDVWGISPIICHSEHKYFVIFIDDFSRYMWIYFLHSKSEVFDAFKKFLAFIENLFSENIKILRPYSGGGCVSHDFQEFLHDRGIISRRSCPYTPQQNGKIDISWMVTRTLLLESSVASYFWVEAISTSVHLINRLPSVKLQNQSPHFRLYGHPPGYTHLHPFGCVGFVHLPSHERHKLSAQSVKCAFLGYAAHQKGFLCFDPKIHRILAMH